MLGSGLNLVTTVIGFAMSATFIFFICARLICGRMRAAAGPPSLDPGFDLELQSDPEQQPEHSISSGGGAEPPVVAAIPTVVKYRRESFPCGEDAQCSICLGDYEEKDMLRILPTCHHNFHRSCIDLWLQRQSTCPICRLPLNGSFDAKLSPPNFRVLQLVDSPEVSNEFSNQWLIPTHQSSEHNENIQEIHEAVSGHN